LISPLLWDSLYDAAGMQGSKNEVESQLQTNNNFLFTHFNVVYNT